MKQFARKEEQVFKFKMYFFIFTSLFLVVNIASAQNRYTDFTLHSKFPEKKGVFWGPFFSSLLPGAGQWYEGQSHQASMYSGIALSGIFLANSAALDEEDVKQMNKERLDETEEEKFRRYQLGGQIYQAAGSFSAYASFQSSVKYKKNLGEYNFIHKQETLDELLLAPFDFSLLKKKTTYIPLVALAGLVMLSDGVSTGELSSSDAFYSASYSYNAGTHEEAMFRGWLMPMLHEKLGSALWGNITSSLLFAAAHGFSPAPLPQLGMGYYLGWLTQKNHYSLKEAIFIHVWWDVIAIAALYMDSNTGHDQSIYVPLYFSAF